LSSDLSSESFIDEISGRSVMIAILVGMVGHLLILCFGRNGKEGTRDEGRECDAERN
jgi:hypothetical protein